MRAQNARDQGAGAGAGNDPRQQALLEQCFDHAQVIETQHTAAAEHQRRAPVANIGAVEEVHFGLDIDERGVEIGQKAQGVVDFVDVLLDKALGAEAGAAVQGAAPHTAHIAVDALVQGKQEALVIVAHAQAAQAIQTQADLRVVVLAAVIDIPPAPRAARLVVSHRGLGPLGVTRRRGHVPVQFFELSRSHAASRYGARRAQRITPKNPGCDIGLSS